MKGFENGYALLIGVDENRVDEYALTDVKKDVNALAKVLTHKRRCAYPAANVRVLTGKDASRQGILDGLKWLREAIRKANGDVTAAHKTAASINRSLMSCAIC